MLPEPFLELLPAPEEQAEKGAPQQRVVDVPPLRFGVAVEYVEERHGRAAQPPQVDHALVGPERTRMEFHAVDVDQLEAVFARRFVEPPEDIGLVEILVAHPLFVQQCRKPGECVEHGQRVRSGKPFGYFRKRGAVRLAGYEIGVGDQPLFAVFAPSCGLGGVDAQFAQAQRVFVGPLRLAFAQERIDDGVECVGTLVALDRIALAGHVESPYLVAPVVQHFARGREYLREPCGKRLQMLQRGVDRKFHTLYPITGQKYGKRLFTGSSIWG